VRFPNSVIVATKKIDVRTAKTLGPWEERPSEKNRQKDKDADGPKKHGKSFYGYKNHVNADAMHKRDDRPYDVTERDVHDSQKFDGLLNKTIPLRMLYGTALIGRPRPRQSSRYAATQSDHQRASRNHPPSKAQENANRKRGRIRARVEHVFGAQQTSPGGRIRKDARHRAGESQNRPQNLAYNTAGLVHAGAHWLPHEGSSVPVRIKRDAGRVNAAASATNQQ